MLSKRTTIIGKKYYKGFTLIELIIVIAILSILSSIAIPSYAGFRRNAKEKVCNINCSQLEKFYHAYLVLKKDEHTEGLYYQYIQEYGQDICTGDGEISYGDGKFRCSIHNKNGDVENGEVPYL